MPWTEQTTMSQKLEFIARLAEWEGPFAGLCERFNMTRVTGHQWRGAMPRAGMGSGGLTAFGDGISTVTLNAESAR